MNTTFVHEAAAIIQKDELQAILKKLADFGLGVCVPHYHDEPTGAFKQLPENLVQSESDLTVTFVDRSDLDDRDIPVAWVWNEGAQIIQSCQTCRVDGPHH